MAIPINHDLLWERVAWRCGASRAMRDAVRKPWEVAVPVARANRRRASADRPRDL